MAIPRDDGTGGGPVFDKYWDDLFPGLERTPLRGRSWEFADAASEGRSLKQAMEYCSEEFGNLTADDGLRTLQGAAPDALAHVITQLDGSFHDLPPVFESMETIFGSHACLLQDLEAEACTALARANTRWTAVETARTERDDADAALTLIDQQIAALQNATDDASLEQLADLEEQRPGVASARDAAHSAFDDAEDALASSRADYVRIRDDELEIIEATADALGDIDLGDLEDPGWLEGFVSSIGDFIGDLASNLGNFLVALAQGDFLDALHYLSEALSGILTVIAIVGLALAVIGTGGMALFVIGLAVGVGKLIVDSVLAGTGHPHPETGEVKTWQGVLVDAGVLVLTAGGGYLAGKGLGALLRGRVTPAQITRMTAAERATYQSNRAIVRMAETGRGRIVNPATGRNVSGAAGRNIARRHEAAAREAVDGHIRRARELGVANAAERTRVAEQTARATDQGRRGGDGLGAGGDLIATAVKPDLDRPAGEWTVPQMADFANSGPVSESAGRHIDSSTRSIESYCNEGPSSRPNNAYVCLVPAA